MNKNKLFRFVSLAIVAMFFVSYLPLSVFGFDGLPEEQQEIYNLGIRYFNYFEDDSSSCISTSGSEGGIDSNNSVGDKLRSTVKSYGLVAMEMQKEYGVPWEMVFSQMYMESSMGTAGIAINGATNNWLGIKGTGDAGSYASPNGSKFAIFSSIEVSINHWARTTLRSGNAAYNAAFRHLDPNNYDLESFMWEIINEYAPRYDGNNPEAYLATVLSIINGPIAEVRTEMGWLSSAEFAQQNDIGIGGNNSIGSDLDESSADGLAILCSSGGNEAINAAAIEMSYPVRHTPWSEWKNKPNDAYYEAMQKVNRGDLNHVTPTKYGDSCDVFVVTVLRSTVDPDIICCTAAAVTNYLRNNPEKYELVAGGNRSVASSEDLQPGDIIANSGHVMVHVQLENGETRRAEASHDSRTADHSQPPYSDSLPEFEVFRWIGGS